MFRVALRMARTRAHHSTRIDDNVALRGGWVAVVQLRSAEIGIGAFRRRASVCNGCTEPSVRGVPGAVRRGVVLATPRSGHGCPRVRSRGARRERVTVNYRTHTSWIGDGRFMEKSVYFSLHLIFIP